MLTVLNLVAAKIGNLSKYGSIISSLKYFLIFQQHICIMNLFSDIKFMFNSHFNLERVMI